MTCVSNYGRKIGKQGGVTGPNSTLVPCVVVTVVTGNSTLEQSKRGGRNSVLDLGKPRGRTSARTSSHKPPSSSFANRLGTSPEVRTLFMSSRNVSTTIWVSSKRNTVGLF